MHTFLWYQSSYIAPHALFHSFLAQISMIIHTVWSNDLNLIPLFRSASNYHSIALELPASPIGETSSEF